MATTYKLLYKQSDGTWKNAFQDNKTFSCVSKIIPAVRGAIKRGEFGSYDELKLEKHQTFTNPKQFAIFPNGQTGSMDVGSSETVLEVLGNMQKPAPKATAAKKSTTKFVLSVQNKVGQPDKRGKQKIATREYPIGEDRIQSFARILLSVNPNILVKMELAKMVIRTGKKPYASKILEFYPVPYPETKHDYCYVNPGLLAQWKKAESLPDRVVNFLGAGNVRH